MDNPFSSVSKNPTERAKSLLTHYLIQASGGFAPESEDALSEISSLVNWVVDAAVNEATSKLNQELESLRNEIQQLHQFTNSMAAEIDRIQKNS